MHIPSLSLSLYIYIYKERARESKSEKHDRHMHLFQIGIYTSLCRQDNVCAIGLMSREFTNDPGDRGSVPGQVIPKTQKMVLDAVLLSTQHYKVRIIGKVKQSKEWSSILPSPRCSSYWKGSRGSPSTKVTYFTLHIYRLTGISIYFFLCWYIFRHILAYIWLLDVVPMLCWNSFFFQYRVLRNTLISFNIQRHLYTHYCFNYNHHKQFILNFLFCISLLVCTFT